jgi:hypothetical protein
MEASGQFHAPTALPSTKQPPESIGYLAGWAPKLVWTLAEKTILIVLGIERWFIGRPALSLLIISTELFLFLASSA